MAPILQTCQLLEGAELSRFLQPRHLLVITVLGDHVVYHVTHNATHMGSRNILIIYQGKIDSSTSPVRYVCSRVSDGANPISGTASVNYWRKSVDI